MPHILADSCFEVRAQVKSGTAEWMSGNIAAASSDSIDTSVRREAMRRWCEELRTTGTWPDAFARAPQALLRLVGQDRAALNPWGANTAANQAAGKRELREELGLRAYLDRLLKLSILKSCSTLFICAALNPFPWSLSK